jgi:hypothetical protein
VLQGTPCVLCGTTTRIPAWHPRCYLSTRHTPHHDRADSIVADAELVRRLLVPGASERGRGRWTLLGQSFGGFCALTYLSMAPEGGVGTRACVMQTHKRLG